MHTPPLVLYRDPLRIFNVLGFRSGRARDRAASGATPYGQLRGSQKFYLSRLKRKKELRAADCAELSVYRIKYRKRGGNSARITPPSSLEV